MSKNKIGIRDLFIAPVTKDTLLEYVAGTPIRVQQVLSVKKKEKKNSLKIYADDVLQSNKTFFDSEDIEFEFNFLDSTARALIYGKKLLKGGITSNSEDETGIFAVGYRTKTLTGKFAMVWHYVCSIEGGEEEDVDTQGEKPKASTVKVKFISQARQKDGNYKYEINENDVVDGDSAAIALSVMDSTIKAPVFLKTVVEPISEPA